MKVEQSDYIKAITPFRNGCSFRPIFDPNGDTYLEPGCYLLVNLIQGAERLFYYQYVENGRQPVKIDATKGTRRDMMKVPACKWCQGAMYPASDAVSEAKESK